MTVKRPLITVQEFLAEVRDLERPAPHQAGVISHPLSTQSFIEHCSDVLAGAVPELLLGSTRGPTRAEPMRHSFELWDALCAEWGQVE